MNRWLPLILIMGMGGGSASATSLATLISGGTITAGNKVFGNFSVPPVNGVTASAIDVVPFTDAGGNSGLRFITSALTIGGSGSNELYADVVFDVTANPGFVIRSVNQAWVANLSPGTITAWNFTDAGTPLVPVAGNCVSGAAGGCLPTALTDSHTYPANPTITSLRVERQIHLLRGKGSPATGTVSSFDATFAEAASGAPPAPAEPLVTAVTRGGSYQLGAVSPGLFVTVWGDRMGPAQVSASAPTAEGKFPTVWAGTRALFDGVAGAVYFTSQQQVSVIVPYAVYGKTPVQLVLEYNGQRSAPFQLDVTDAAPGIFSQDLSGTGPGAILNVQADGTVALNTAQALAPRGTYISVYMTGEGQTDPGGVDGSIAVTVLPKPLLKVSATIGGVPATVQYAGGAAYMVAGAMQVNLLVPADAPTGPAVPLVVQVGDKRSQAGITVAIGN
jgi:uncharacterized protein (TIGR03437 family)